MSGKKKFFIQSLENLPLRLILCTMPW